MADDERLREALLELQFLRDREARALKETQSLLNCLESYSTAAGPAQALSSLFQSLRSEIDADCTILVAAGDGDSVYITASDDPRDIGQILIPPTDIMKRPRNLANMHAMGVWDGDFDATPYTGLIIVPVTPDVAMLTFRVAPRAFAKGDHKLVERLAGFAVQAQQNAEIASENNLLAATIAGSSSGFAIADATDADRPLIYVNKAFEQLSGYTSDEVLGKNCRFLSAEPPDSPERERLRLAVKHKTEGTFLLRNRRKSGVEFWNELTLFPVTTPDGQIR
ncbi:MAG: PAS domain-containing protein, partial [Pseudomonadota bacterium]